MWQLGRQNGPITNGSYYLHHTCTNDKIVGNKFRQFFNPFFIELISFFFFDKRTDKLICCDCCNKT